MLLVVRGWSLRGATSAAAKWELQRDPWLCSCPVSLPVGTKTMADAEMLSLCSELSAAASGATFSELCRIGADPRGTGAVPAFRNRAEMREAPEGLSWEQQGGGLAG